MRMFIAALFSTGQSRRNPTVHQNMNGEKKMYFTSTMEYHSAIKKVILIRVQVRSSQNHYTEMEKPESQNQKTLEFKYVKCKSVVI